MNDRTGFLLARIADDEAHARSAFGEHNDVEPEWSEVWSGAVSLSGNAKSWDELLITNDSQVSRYIARFDPARVLAECKVKRRIVEAAWADHLQIEGEWGHGRNREELSAQNDYPEVVRLLALPYADHKDFPQEWLT